MFTYTIEPRFSETDALGHVSNTSLPAWFEQARTPIFRLFNPNLAIASWNLILKNLNIDFVAQIYYGKAIEIRTTIAEIRNASFSIRQEIWQDAKQVAIGTTVLVYFDYEQQVKAEIPAVIREQLVAHMRTEGC